MNAEIVAHRGYSARAPENTLSALEAALGTGVPAVEFDVRTAACGTPVLFHDPLLGRTTNGVGPLHSRTLEQLKALDAGAWFASRFAGETIPTQEEALDHLRERVEWVYQDIKGYREMEDLDRMARVTRRTGMAASTVFVSSNWSILNRLRGVAPEIMRGYTVEGAATLSSAMERAAADPGSLLSVEVGVALADPERIRGAVAKGMELMIWTVDDPEQAQRALDLGASHLMSNEVEHLLAWRAGVG